jgi:hypothetical protein
MKEEARKKMEMEKGDDDKPKDASPEKKDNNEEQKEGKEGDKPKSPR